MKMKVQQHGINMADNVTEMFENHGCNGGDDIRMMFREFCTVGGNCRNRLPKNSSLLDDSFHLKLTPIG
jgi:hypothetical protein